MTLNEFKIWLDGFQEGVIDTPTKEQWQRIKQKLSEVREEYTFPPQIGEKLLGEKVTQLYPSMPIWLVPPYPAIPYNPHRTEITC